MGDSVLSERDRLMFDRIYIPVDGSDCATRAAKHGLELADTYDAAVDVAYVVEPGRLPSVGSSDESTARREDGEAVLADAEALAADVGRPVTTHLLEGTPHEEIVSHAAERDADLLAMGRQGRGRLGERLLGSVALRVVRNVDVPVLVVPEGRLDAATGTGYDGILLPTDGSENAEAATPYGADVAGRYGATLHVLNAVDVQSAGGMFSAGGVSEEFVERLEADGAEIVERLESRIADLEPDVDCRTAVVRGTPHEEIGEYVAAEGIGLIVMGSRGTDRLGGHLLGSVTDRLLRIVDVPVLIVTPSARQ